ncbi:MAG: hypothetical protein ACOX8S_06600 [Christensenellales bacterium]
MTVGMATNASVKDWATNEQTLCIEEITGIDLDFIDIAKNEYVTKIDLMMVVNKIAKTYGETGETSLW